MSVPSIHPTPFHPAISFWFGVLGCFLHPCEMHPLHLEHQVLHNKLRSSALNNLLWMVLQIYLFTIKTSF